MAPSVGRFPQKIGDDWPRIRDFVLLVGVVELGERSVPVREQDSKIVKWQDSREVGVEVVALALEHTDGTCITALNGANMLLHPAHSQAGSGILHLIFFCDPLTSAASLPKVHALELAWSRAVTGALDREVVVNGSTGNRQGRVCIPRQVLFECGLASAGAQSARPCWAALRRSDNFHRAQHLGHTVTTRVRI